MNKKPLHLFRLATFLLITLIISCKKDSKEKNLPLVDETVYSEIDFTDQKIDSAEVAKFLNSNQIPDSLKTQVSNFYKRRNYQFGWFTNSGTTYPVKVFTDLLASYKNDFDDNSLDNQLLDSLTKLVKSDQQTFLKTKSNPRLLDMLLTASYFQYADKVYGGLHKNPVDLEWFIPRKKKDYQLVLDSLVSRKENDLIKEPENRYYSNLKNALKNYRRIEKSGGFPAIAYLNELKKGDSSIVVKLLKSYLRLAGDYQNEDTSMIFTADLSKALKNYQDRMGLVTSGKLNKATAATLNVPVRERIKQIMVNLERLRWVPEEFDQNFILVNIPEFRLHVFEKDKLVWETNVVVGKEINRTNIFKGNIKYVVLNPYWNIPNSILKNEIIPAMDKNPNYLAKHNMEIVSNKPLQIRQKPGNNNSLGKMKFLFPNNFSIYLHDTPAKSLFTQNKRAYSHGCVRVENPTLLAKLLLKNQESWLKQVDTILKTEKETWITIKPTMPVYIVYFTAWVDHTGQLNFRNDVYNHDKELALEIFGKQ